MDSPHASLQTPVGSVLFIARRKGAGRKVFGVDKAFRKRRAGDDVRPGEPAVEVDIGAAARAERMKRLDRGLAADRTRANRLQRDAIVGWHGVQTTVRVDWFTQ